MQELRRRMSSALSWGIDGVSLVTPAEIKQMVPFIDESILVGGFSTPSVGVVDSLRAGTLMRERAQEAGALTVQANTEVLGIDVEHGRVRRVRTTRGDIEADIVVIACGVWSPKLARMAGASIPLTPAVHQMIDVGPVPRFATAKSHIEYPIVRDMDTNMYERQDGAGLEIGSYAHRPILHDPEEIPSIEEAALSPTEFPFTQADFEQQMEHALELMPEIVGDETVGVKYAINGILSLTPDGLPVLGRDARGQGPLVGRGGVGQGGPGRSARRSPSGWCTASPRSICTRPTSPASTSTRRRARTCARARPRASTRPTASSTRASSGRPTATCGCRRSTRASRSWARSSSRPPAGSGRSGTSRTRRCSRSTATASPGARPSGTRAGGRRSSTPSTWRCATAPAWST